MWSNQRNTLIASGMTFYVRCRTTNMMLGTMPNNIDIQREFVASKAPLPEAEEQEVKATELAINTAISNDQELEDIQMTIFPRAIFGKVVDSAGHVFFFDPEYDIVPEGAEMVNLPFIYDYQWRGSFKESMGMLSKADKAKAEYAAAGVTAYKKVVDGNWFIIQRKIPLLIPDTFVNMSGETIPTYDPNGNLRTFSRPIRAETAKGPRTALATSEIVPSGTEFYFGIRLLNSDNLRACLETLDYKALMGMLQWRGGGKGTLDWTLATKSGIPYDELDASDLTDADKAIIAQINDVIPDVTKFGNEFDAFKPAKKTAAPTAKKGRGKKKEELSEDEGSEDTDETVPEVPEETAAPKRRGRPPKNAAKADD